MNLPYSQCKSLDDYVAFGHRNTPGWLWQSAAYLTAIVGLKQSLDGMRGNVGEIGLWQGRYLTLLGLLSSNEESIVGIDSFVHSSDPAGFQNRIKTRFESDPLLKGRLRLITEDSTKLRVDDIKKVASNPFRLFSIDGGHMADEVFSDVNLICNLMCEGGVMIIDDILNPTCPGVIEGMLRFFNSPAGANFAAFCLVGNKMLVTQRSKANDWRQFLLKFIEKHKAISLFRDTAQTIANFPPGVFPRLCNSDMIVVTWSGDYLISDEGQPVLLRTKVCDPAELNHPDLQLPSVVSLMELG